MKHQKSIYIFYLLLLIVGGGCGKSEPEKETIPTPDEKKTFTIRVLTYNIFHGENFAGKIDMDLFGQIIKSEMPDLVALQEVDKFTSRSGGIDITKELSDRTGLTGYFGKARDFQGGEYGLAVLSKLPVTEFTVVPAYKTGTYGTNYVFAKVKLAENTFIYFNSSHFSTALEERQVHAQDLLNYYKVNLKGEPLIICGDLNAQHKNPEMQVLWNDFALSDPSLGNTFSTRSGMRSKIDFVLYPKTDNWKVISVKRICRPDASDHCALLSVLEYTR